MPGEDNQIKFPYYKHFAEDNEEDTFKLISEITIHNMGWGYTCFVSAFAIFISDKEIKINKSTVVKKFIDINTEEKFNNLNLPIKNVTECEADGKTVVNKCFEIDISRPIKL